MTNIHFVIPVIAPSSQDFTQLIDQLSGGYVQEDVVIERFDGEEETLENPYKGIEPLDFSGNITFVSNSEFNAPQGSNLILLDEELNIAKMWNAGIQNAEDATHIVVLNEVSSINPVVIKNAIDENDSDIINISDGGCFIVKPHVRANEDYRLWFADIDLFERYETTSVRDGFIDLRQDHIEITEELKQIAESDQEKYNSR